MILKYRFPFFGLLLLSAACATSTPPSPFPAGLQGMIYDNSNNAVSGAQLQLQLPPLPLYSDQPDAEETTTDGQKAAKTPNPPPEPEELFFSTDIEGRFLLPDLMPGEYRLLVRCDGFESREFSIRFSDPGQVLYFKMISLDFLQEKIEDSLGSRDYEAAEDFIHRAETIDAEDPVLVYLTAVSAALREEWTAASEQISRLKEAGFSSEGLENLSELIEEKCEKE